MAAAREDWRREVAQCTKEETDRAWASNNEDELGKQTRELEEKVRKRLQAEREEEKRKLVEDTFREAETKYTNENVNLREELRKMKASFFTYCRGVELVHFCTGHSVIYFI